MTPVSISVVICTHNRRDLLGKTLDSLRAMSATETITWDVCVVDNRSTDDTSGMVADYAARWPAFPLRGIVETRQGIAFARNAGVSASGASVIAFVDDDVLVQPTWLSFVHAGFAADPDLAIMGGRLTANPESPMPPWMDGLNPAPIGLVDFGDARKVLTVPYLATANCAFRRQAIVDAGMFDVRRGRQPDKLYADEDTDMVAKIQRAGGKVIYEPAISARHFVPNKRMTREYFRRWYRERGEGVGLVRAEGGRSLFGIPLFEYRQALSNGQAYLARLVSGRPTFQQELSLGYFSGIVAGRLKSRARREVV